MVVTNTFYLTAESYRQWLEANQTAVSVDANNVQKSPLVIRSWSGEGSDKTAYPVYLTLQVESVAGTSTEVLYTYKSSSKVSEYTYTLPSDKYATANRITVSAYDDAARTKAVGSVQLNILADNPVPYPRAEEWSDSLVYKNGEYLKVDNVLYMWTSRVPGNTTTDPKTWIQNNPTSKLWTEYPYNTLLAGQILLFDFAKIGQAIFKDQYMLSQHGIDADGNESDDYRNFTGEDGTDFQPNILLNFLTGKAYMSEAEIRGHLTTAKNGKRIELDPDTNSLRMYDENENLVCRFYFRSNGTPPSYPYIEMAQFDNSGKQISSLEMMPAVINEWVQMDSYTLGWTITPTVGLQFTRNGEVKKSYPSS